jgi:tetratricopeptide (TPR) repeat protein
MRTSPGVEWSLLLSAVAVTISLVSTAITLLQKRYETFRMLRQQITDAVSRLLELAQESSLLQFDPAVDRSTVQFQTRSQIISQQHAFYARHALFLMELGSTIVSDADYLAVAAAFQQVADYTQANIAYDRAIKKAHKGYPTVIALRFYAYALYSQGDVITGARRYAAAAETFKKDRSLYGIFTTAYTYQLWAFAEATMGDLPEARRLFALAATTYMSIKSDRTRQHNLQSLTTEMQKFFSHEEVDEIVAIASVVK